METYKLFDAFLPLETGEEKDGGTLSALLSVEEDGVTFSSPMFLYGTVEIEDQSLTREDTEEEEHPSLSVASSL